MKFYVGEIRTTKGGEQYEIIEVNSSMVSTGGIVIRFTESGVIRVTDAKSVAQGSINSKKKVRVSIGEKFNRLTVIERASASGDKNAKWLCACECGNTCTPTTIALTRGHTTSCGCYKKEVQGKSSITHGMTDTREYGIWAAMKQRCFDPNKDNYPRYGGRGITVCDEWKNSFQQFYADMGDCPEGLTLERIDPNGHYCKENCKWDTKNMQGYNTNRHCTNTTGRTGVYYNKRQEKWTAAIGVESKLIHLGTFDSYESACRAREDAELEYYGFNKE